MILTFKTQFIEPIKSGTKIHTIREDKQGRWKTGMKIHFWSSNPRNIKSSPYMFGLGKCIDVKEITIDFTNEDILLVGKSFNDILLINDFIKLDEFAKSDGFKNWDYLKEWFYNQYPEIKSFVGKIIYFEADTSFTVSEDQNTIICYGETYNIHTGNCINECDLNKKRKCSKTPCTEDCRKDNRSFVVFKKVKENGNPQPTTRQTV